MTTSAEPVASPGPLRILVVEDEELDRLGVRRCLNQSGIRAVVDEATSAGETLDCLRGAAYDCLLLDYYIPGVDGLALLRGVQALAPELPVVMFTGRGDEEIAVELMKAGAADYLPKALLTPERLASSIRHALELARSAAARERAENELRAQEARFRTLANAIPQLAWMTDASGGRTWFNQRWFDYTGTTLEEVQGWAWRAVHHPDHVQRVVDTLQQSLATGEPWEDTHPLRGSDGTYRWFLSRAIPVRDQGRNIIGWLGTNTDITDRMRSEEERAALLERERAARADAEAALEARDAFFSSVTHDLKNPLGAVKGYAQLLKRRLARTSPSPPDWLTEGLDQIQSNADRTSSLIEEVLDLVRHREIGRLELQRSSFDLVELCRNVISIQPRAASRHELVLVPSVTELLGNWDGPRLERVVANLIDNAIKYSPEGGRVVVRIDREPWAGQPRAVISVSDEGVGIPAADLPLIFDQFQRAGNVVDRIAGSGIGLTSVRQIVEAHGGTVAVDSRQGVGSTLTVRLPLSGLSRLDGETKQDELQGNVGS